MNSVFRWRFLMSLVLICLICGTANAEPCLPIPGSDQLWSNSSIRWVWVGETHGTNEAPAMFYRLVCGALAHGKHVTVALERLTTEQPALDGLMTNPDLPAAEHSLLAQPSWKEGLDGRSSKAMLDLLISLRTLHQRYQSLKVAAIDGPTYTAAQGSRDEAIGRSVLQLDSDQTTDIVLVLTGNLHAIKNPIYGYKTSAMYLPSEKLVSLETTDRTGTAWMWTNLGCGPTKAGVRDKDANRPTGIYLDPTLARIGNVDGILALGEPLTASSPATPEEIPLPDCREKFEHSQNTAPGATSRDKP